MFAISIQEMGLTPPTIILIFVFGVLFLFSFALTSKNMDTKGLLRVLYAKPLRKSDGSVEYRNKE